MKVTRVFAVLLLVLLPCLLLAQDESTDEEKTKLNPGTFSGLAFRNIGPAFMSGRIADIAINQNNPNIRYVAVGSGNVWKTENAGTTWTPIFDNESSYSIGCVTIDPSNENIIWIGTGENVDGRHVGFGDGVYKSLDAGKTWKNMGLKQSDHIGRIVVDPRDSNVVYVAAKGPLWNSGGERGVYKSVDGGENWELVLAGANEWTGCNEVIMHPENPDILFAAMHQRHRTVAALINGGPGSGIYKSTDAGKTWRELKTGLPAADKGRIGIAISPIKPDVVYATIELAKRDGGFFRSADGGESWEKRNSYISGGTGPHYYQEIFASPHEFDVIYQMDVFMHRSKDGGKSWTNVGSEVKHTDNHALAFNPNNPDYLLAGCDGGLYESFDGTKTWKYVANLPVTQFYKLAVDNREPFYNIYGGTQDNNSQGGPSRTLNTNGIRNSDWFVILFADGHQPATDPEYNDIVYANWQQGNLVRYDHKTGEVVYLQAQPAPGEPAENWNWDSPILVSPHNPARIYHASRRVWRSDDRGDSWTAISDTLSRGLDRFILPLMGRVWSFDAAWDLSAMSNFGNITSLSESPVVEGLIYAGTDDGLIQVTEDGGANWRKIETQELPGVPQFAFINDIKADQHDADTVYVCLDNHKAGDYKPYLYKSADRGKTWTSIGGTLPDRHLVWRIVQDYQKPELMFLATEFGIFFTVDGGGKWVKFNGGMPTISFRDLAIQKRENDLVGASFGRGFFILDDYSPLRMVNEEMLEQEATLFPVKDALLYLQRSPMGGSGKAYQGDGFFTAPNPPYGAIFTYYMADSIKTKKKQRQEAEAKVKKEGGDNPYPGYDAIREENREENPAIILTVTDSDGNIVRRVTGPANAGFHRVAWDLHYPTTEPVSASRGGGGDPFGEEPSGSGIVMVAPGAFTVSLAKRVDGVVTDLGMSQTFNVEPLYPEGGTLTPATTLEERKAFLMEVAEFQRVLFGADEALNDTLRKIGLIVKALDNSTAATAEMRAEAIAIKTELEDLRNVLVGDLTIRRTGNSVAPGVFSRIQTILTGNLNSLYGPTKHHRQNLAWAKEQYGEAHPRIKELVDATVPALERKLEEAGIAWTSGRAIPDYQP